VQRSADQHHDVTQLQQASGDIRATWRTAQSLLHSRQKVIYDDSECADLVGKFNLFFVDKVRRIRDNIASMLKQSSPRVFAARPHTGPELSDFQPVTIDEVQKLLASIPRKTSPLDVLSVSLLKDCAEVFAPAITTLANLSLQTGKFPARFKSVQVLPLLKNAGLDRSLPVNYRPISNLSTVSKVLKKLALARPDDTQLHLAMRVDNTAAGLSILAACITDVKQWYMQNGLQLNPDKSEALFVGTVTQLRAVSSLKSVSVADVDLPVADSMRVLGVILDRRLTFDNHASAVARSCNYHARAIRHIRHLLMLDLAQMLACSLILSRIDYCNSVLHGAPCSTI